MDAKDRNFLARADTVTAKYQHRIIELEETLERQLLASLLDVSRVNLDVLNKMDRLEKLQAEYTAHTQRVTKLREQQRQTQAFNQLCADANKLAGTDGANFFTKAGKVFENEQEAPDEQNDDRTAKQTTDV